MPPLGLAVGLRGVGWARLVTPRLRRQELEANAAAAGLVGAPAVGAAVVRGHDLADIWDSWMRTDAWPAVRTGARAAGLVADLSTRLLDPLSLDTAARGHRRQRPCRLDPHPTVGQRLQALGGLVDDPEAQPAAPPATSLLRDPGLLDRAALDLLPRSEPLRGWLREKAARRHPSPALGPATTRPCSHCPARSGALAVLHLTSLAAVVAAVLAALTIPLDLGHRSTLDEVRLVVALGLAAVLARAAAVPVLQLSMRGPA